MYGTHTRTFNDWEGGWLGGVKGVVQELNQAAAPVYHLMCCNL